MKRRGDVWHRRRGNARLSGRRSDARRHAHDLGLTLLETLIVLVVIAVAAGATILSFGPRRGNATEVEAQQLAHGIESAVDRSIATGGHAVLVVDGGGYTIAGAPRHLLPAGTILAGRTRVLPLGLGDGSAFALILAHGDDHWTIAFDGIRAVATAGDAA